MEVFDAWCQTILKSDFEEREREMISLQSEAGSGIVVVVAADIAPASNPHRFNRLSLVFIIFDYCVRDWHTNTSFNPLPRAFPSASPIVVTQLPSLIFFFPVFYVCRCVGGIIKRLTECTKRKAAHDSRFRHCCQQPFAAAVCMGVFM